MFPVETGKTSDMRIEYFGIEGKVYITKHSSLIESVNTAFKDCGCIYDEWRQAWIVSPYSLTLLLRRYSPLDFTFDEFITECIEQQALVEQYLRKPWVDYHFNANEFVPVFELDRITDSTGFDLPYAEFVMKHWSSDIRLSSFISTEIN